MNPRRVVRRAPEGLAGHPRRHTPYTRRRSGLRGQIIPVFMLFSVIIFGFIGFAVDGGYALYMETESQNAADFAALATSSLLQSNCTFPGSVQQSSIATTIDEIVGDNLPQANIKNKSALWSAQYLNDLGGPITPVATTGVVGGSNGTVPTGTAPNGACGIAITVAPQWSPYVLGVIGVTSSLSSAGVAQAVFNPPGYASVSIVALGTNQAHNVFSGGSGQFNVIGTLASNANDYVYAQTTGGGAPYSNLLEWGGGVDAVDTKDISNMEVQGNIQSVVTNPFDSCYGTPQSSGSSSFVGPTTYQATCNSSYIDYNGWSGGHPAVPNPFASYPDPANASYAGCDGATPSNPTDPLVTSTTVAGVTTLHYWPGTYTTLTQITGNAVFENCATKPGSKQTGGIFVFQNGLEVLPAAGKSVTGSDVLIVGEHPIAQFAGGGAPLKGWMTSTANGTSYDPYYCTSCGKGASPKTPNSGALPTTGFPFGTTGSAYGPAFSIDLGGQGSVILSGFTDTSGDELAYFNGFGIWQEPTIAANIGLNAIPAMNNAATVGLLNKPSGGTISYAGDSGAVTINNANVYNNSLPLGNLDTSNNIIYGNYYNKDNGNGGIPFTAGGTVQGGTGDYCSDAGADCTAGTVNINNGIVIVDAFSTNGKTDFTVKGAISNISGIIGSGPTLVG